MEKRLIIFLLFFASLGGIFFFQQGLIKKGLFLNLLPKEVNFLTETIKEKEEMLLASQNKISLLEESLKKEGEIREKTEKEYFSKIKELKESISELSEKVNLLNQNLLILTEELKREGNKQITASLESKDNKEVVSCQKNSFTSLFQNKVIFNEIAWMGSQNSTDNEWIELKNISDHQVDFTGWQISNKEEKIKIILKGVLPPGGFYLLERKSDETIPGVTADLIFSGAIKNSDEALYLFDQDCQLQDEVEANPSWPAGDNNTKQTMERKPDLSWQTSQNVGGTPKRENSPGYLERPSEVDKSETPFQIQPQISLSYPKEIPSNKEILAELSLSGFKNLLYDLKLSIEKEGIIFSDIYNQKEEKWQSSFSYLKEVFSGPSFQGSFRLKIKEEKKYFRGEAEIIVRIRESGKTNYSQFISKINILEPTEPETSNLLLNEFFDQGWEGTTLSGNPLHWSWGKRGGLSLEDPALIPGKKSFYHEPYSTPHDLFQLGKTLSANQIYYLRIWVKGTGQVKLGIDCFEGTKWLSNYYQDFENATWTPMDFSLKMTSQTDNGGIRIRMKRLMSRGEKLVIGAAWLGPTPPPQNWPFN